MLRPVFGSAGWCCHYVDIFLVIVSLIGMSIYLFIYGDATQTWKIATITFFVFLPAMGRFGDVTQTAYSFWLYDLCDNYLELIKPVVGDRSEGNKKVGRAALAGRVGGRARDYNTCILYSYCEF